MFKLIKGLISNTANAKESLENDLLLIDNTWLLLDNSSNKKTTYIFWSRNNELIISESGNIKRGVWQNIKGSNKLLLEVNGISKLYLILYLRENYFIFKNDYEPDLFVCVNESNYTNLYANYGAKLLDVILKESGNKTSLPSSKLANIQITTPSQVVQVPNYHKSHEKSDSDYVDPEVKKYNEQINQEKINRHENKKYNQTVMSKSDEPPTELDKHIEAMKNYLNKK